MSIPHGTANRQSSTAESTRAGVGTVAWRPLSFSFPRCQRRKCRRLKRRLCAVALLFLSCRRRAVLTESREQRRLNSPTPSMAYFTRNCGDCRFLSFHDLSAVFGAIRQIRANYFNKTDAPMFTKKACKHWRLLKLAASLGLEPRQTDPESVVLPLHHEAVGVIRVKSRTRRKECQDVGPRSSAVIDRRYSAIFYESRMGMRT